MTTVGSESLWDVQDVMRALKVKKSWVYQRCDTGELPHCRLGGHIRFDPKDVRAYVEQCKCQPARVVSIKREKDGPIGEQS